MICNGSREWCMSNVHINLRCIIRNVYQIGFETILSEIMYWWLFHSSHNQRHIVRREALSVANVELKKWYNNDKGGGKTKTNKQTKHGEENKEQTSNDFSLQSKNNHNDIFDSTYVHYTHKYICIHLTLLGDVVHTYISYVYVISYVYIYINLLLMRWMLLNVPV